MTDLTLVTKDLTTTSLAIAELFGREHKNILRTIRGIIKDMSSDDFNALKIAPVDYIDSKGESRPAYSMGEEMTLIITGRLTGSNAFAAQMKLAKAFIAMRDLIRSEMQNKKLAAEQSLTALNQQLLAQSSELQAMKFREPRDEKTLAVVMGCSTYHVIKHYDILVRNGYLIRRELPPHVRYVYEPTPLLGKLCTGNKGDTLLFTDKVKDLVECLNVQESLFD